MNNTQQKHTQLLVLACIDGSTISSAVCDYSAWIAQRIDAPLKLLHNIEHQETPDTEDLDSSEGQEEVTGEVDPEAQKAATLKKIQSIRDEIAASGKDHLSDYWIETLEFEVIKE